MSFSEYWRTQILKTKNMKLIIINFIETNEKLPDYYFNPNNRKTIVYFQYQLCACGLLGNLSFSSGIIHLLNFIIQLEKLRELLSKQKVTKIFIKNLSSADKRLLIQTLKLIYNIMKEKDLNFMRKIISSGCIDYIEKCHFIDDPIVELYCYGIYYFLYNICIYIYLVSYNEI